MVVAPAKDFRKNITGLILAGGAGQRLKTYAHNKGLLPLNGEALALHVVKRLEPQVFMLAISANKNLDEYDSFGLPVWADMKEANWEEFPGPLAGILTGLHHIQTPWLVTAPCDSPLVPPNLVEKLYQKACETNSKVVIASTKIQNDHEGNHLKDHPVFALIHASLKESLHQYLLGGDRKIMLWMKQQAFERVIFDEQEGFMANINTIEDFNHLNELMSKQK